MCSDNDMEIKMNKSKWLIAVTGALIALTLPACRENGSRTARESEPPPTTAEKRAQGDAILNQMSEKLRSTQALAFSTNETSDRVRRNNEKVKINFDRQVAARRPDRLWFKISGDPDLECFYDGKRVTLVTHKNKVFGQFKALPTLDETADLITSRYDIPLPIADLLASNPHAVLLSDKTTGGWEKRETVEGIECNALAYQHPNVDFSIWIPAAGDPLPKKLQITYKARRGQPSTTILFKDWNLSPQVSDETFVAKVPDDYEGIPVIQRASAVIPQSEVEKKEAQTPAPATRK
jgi:hypothetical protein